MDQGILRSKVLARPAILQHQQLIASDEIDDFDDVCSVPGLGKARGLEGHVLHVPAGPRNAIVADFIALALPHPAGLTRFSQTPKLPTRTYINPMSDERNNVIPLPPQTSRFKADPSVKLEFGTSRTATRLKA